jgi:hypothetical protein
MIGYDRVSTPADLAPSFLNQIALRKLRWIPLATVNTPVCMGAWHVECNGCQPTQ